MNLAKRMSRKANALRNAMKGITLSFNSSWGTENQHLYPSNFDKAVKLTGNGELVARILEGWKFNWRVDATVFYVDDFGKPYDQTASFAVEMERAPDLGEFVEDELIPQLKAMGNHKHFKEWGYVACLM